MRKIRDCFKQINNINIISNEYVSLNDRNGKFVAYSNWTITRSSSRKKYGFNDVNKLYVYSYSNNIRYILADNEKINLGIFRVGCLLCHIKGHTPEWLNKYIDKMYICITNFASIDWQFIGD
jgi:hypothetical protein